MGRKVSVLQTAITIASTKGFLDQAAVANAIVGLASLRHVHVSLSSNVLCEDCRIDDTDRHLKFRAATEFIGPKSAEIASRIGIAAHFLNNVWTLNIADLSKRACSGIILEQLLRFRTHDYKEILRLLRSKVRGSMHASTYLEDWIRGHFSHV